MTEQEEQEAERKHTVKIFKQSIDIQDNHFSALRKKIRTAKTQPTTGESMNAIQQAALTRAIKTLGAMGCTFAIVDADKELHGSPLTVLDELGSTYAVIDAAGVRHGLVSAVLEKMECNYVITTKEGMKYSNTVEKTPEAPPKPTREFPHGDTRGYVRPFIEPMEVGATVAIPVDKYGAHNIQNSVTSWFVTNLGKNSCTTFRNKATGCVDVMRIG